MSKIELQKPAVQSGRVSPSSQVQKMTREELAKQIRNMRDRDAEMVTGIFKNLENPASAGGRGSVIFNYKAYPGDEFAVYELCDGERYTLPRGVARHLNNNCYTKEYQHLPGEFGTQGIRGGISDGRLASKNMQMARKVHRYSFHSLEYMDDDTEMNASNLVEVSVTP